MSESEVITATKTLVDIRKMLSSDEGRLLLVYRDTKRILTCGIGHNLQANPCKHILGRTLVYKSPITNAECDALFAYDLAAVHKDLAKNIPNYLALEYKYRVVLINLCFNMGINRLMKFKNTIAAMVANNAGSVAYGIKNSAYAKQLPERSSRMIALVNGKIPPEYATV